MRKFLRKKYEKNTKNLNIIYFFLKFVFILFGKYKTFKIETKDALETFESFKLKSKEYKEQYRKLIVYRYIYYLRASEFYLYDLKDVAFSKFDTFMTRQLTNRYYNVINNQNYRKVLNYKNLSYEIFKDYYKRDLVCIKDKNDYSVFEEFIKNKKSCILKPFDGHSGENIEIINVDDFNSIDELFDYTLKKTPYVLEELIKQDLGLGIFHEQSVNTVRVVTFQFKDNISILWAFLRTGQGESKVDNMGSSGYGALIDEDNGKVVSNGFDWKGDEVKIHPDSKIKFKGFQIPKWKELLELVKDLSSTLPEMHCVGWDLALTSDGWVLVEGNARPQCVTIQMFTKRGYKDYYEKMYTLVKDLNDKQMEDDAL